MTYRENVIADLDELRIFADTDVHPIVSPDNWNVYAELCDMIDKARDDVVYLLKAQEPSWISVQGRLPDNGQDVLAYLDDGEETRVAPCNYANGVWFDCVMNRVVTLHHITHWMPLPEPPKEET